MYFGRRNGIHCKNKNKYFLGYLCYELAIQTVLIALTLAVGAVVFQSSAYAQPAAEQPVVAEPALRAPNTAGLRRPDNTGWDDTNFETAFRPANHRGAPKATGTLQQSLRSAGGDRRDTPGSSNFQIVAPVLSLPGRGMDLNLALIYNSNLWHLENRLISYDIDRDWPAPGWSLGFGKLAFTPRGNILYAPDGTRHQLSREPYPSNPQRFSGRSTGGGGFIDYDYYQDATGQFFYGTVRYADGLQVSYRAQGSSRSVIYPVNMTDVHGNSIIIRYRDNTGPQIESILDTAGRFVRFHYDENDLLTAVTGPGDKAYRVVPGCPGSA